MSELILVRHGQSIWNLQNRFTGWYDVALSNNGVAEAKKAAEQKKKEFTTEIELRSIEIFKESTSLASSLVNKIIK